MSLERRARIAVDPREGLGFSSADVFDDLEQLAEAVALAAGEVDEFLTAPRSSVPATVMPRPRRNSSSLVAE